MVEETNLDGTILFKCEKCGWLYKEETMAKKCEAYCKEHEACNLKYARFAIKPMKMVEN